MPSISLEDVAKLQRAFKLLDLPNALAGLVTPADGF